MMRKCKYCDKPAKKNIIAGRNKGYLRTCGHELCLKYSFSDKEVCIKKGIPKKNLIMKCEICSKDFNKRTSNNTKYCIDCAPSKKWQRVAQRYKIGKQQWDKLYELQNGTCALCDKNAIFVDHDHATGKVRGLLCPECNHLVIGIERGDDWIIKAKKYLDNQFDFENIKLEVCHS